MNFTNSPSGCSAFISGGSSTKKAPSRTNNNALARYTPRWRGVSVFSNIARISLSYRCRASKDGGSAAINRSTNCFFDSFMAEPFPQHLAQCELGVVQARFHRALWYAQNRRDLFNGQVFEEKQRQHLAMCQGKRRQAPVNLLRILEFDLPIALVASESFFMIRD